jgi:hypothetical protein
MMDLIYRLLGIDVPSGTDARDLELQFRGPMPWYVVVLIVLLLAGLAALLYTRERGKLAWWSRLIGAALRTAFLAGVVLLICRPVLQAEFHGQRPREILFFIDNTQSMKQRDRRLVQADLFRVALAEGKIPPNSQVDGLDETMQPPAATMKDPARGDLVRAVLQNSDLKLLEDLQKRGPLVPQLFGHDAHLAVTDFSLISQRALKPANVLKRFNADESETALADTLYAAVQRKDSELPAAIVVFTDGRDNASKYTLDEAARECARRNVPLHIYGVGSARAGRLKLRDIGVADKLFAEDQATASVRWRADGIPAGTAVVTVTLAGIQQTKQIPIRTGEDQVTEFTFTVPRIKDRVDTTEVTANVRLMDDDSFQDEDRRSVRIIDGKIKVLYIEYSPRKEYHFLETVLLRDRRLDPRFWLITADPKAFLGGPFERDFPTKKDLAAFDLVVLGDVPGDKLRPAHRELLRDFVSNGRGGLIVLAGRQHMPADYAGSKDLAEMLPVEFLARRFSVDGPGSPQPFNPVLTSAAMRSEWLQLTDLADQNAKQWHDLPGMYWYYPVSKLRPGALPLMVHPTAKMGEEPMPLMVMHSFGKGQVVFVGFEETWRWRYNTREKLFGRYWSQLLLHFGLPHMLAGSASRVELALDRTEVLLGKPGAVYARMLDRNFDPLRVGEVEGELRFLDAKQGQEAVSKLIFDPVPGREKEGEYKALLPNNQVGRWQIRLADPEQRTLEFTVKTPPRHELEDSPMAADLLRSAASISGGRFYQEEDLHEMAQSVEPRSTSFAIRQEALLWGPIPFLLLAALVACEWLVRKLTNLS